jgi:four helix bundle protein
VNGSDKLKERTQAYALRVIRLVGTLPNDGASGVIGKQLLRSATSVGANYRAACRAKSPADFIAKMGIVEEEADESLYWMELLMTEGNELVAIAVSSIKAARTTTKPKP